MSYTDEQLQFIDYKGDDSIILSATAGSGKEQPLFCKVLTPAGWRQMGDLKPGDVVLTPTGELSKITNIYPQGLKATYKINFSDGSFTYAGKEHLWRVQTRYQRSNGSPHYQVLTTDKISEKLYITDCNGKKYSFYYIPLTDIAYPEKSLPIDPYLLGCLLGDGGISQQSQIGFTNSDSFIVNQIHELVKPFGVRLSECKNDPGQYRISKPKEDSDGHNGLITVLRKLGLMGHLSVEKFIPREYMTASKEQRFRLLNGILDTDGYPENNSIVITLSSKLLVDNIVELVNSIGGIVYVRPKKGRYKKDNIYIECNQAYVMHICLPEEMKYRAFTLPRKAEGLVKKGRTHVPYRAFESIEYFDTVECQCIEIDHPDHLYVTDNHIVTHNTHSCVGRLNQLIADGVDPKRIIFFSFTNDAVNELKSRIKHDVQITTIHSYTAKLLGKMGKFKNIITFYNFVSWYKEKFKPNPKDPKTVKDLYYQTMELFYEEGNQISSAFAAHKLQMADGIRLPKPTYYPEYEKFLKETKSRDFSDMLIDTEKITRDEKFKEFLEETYDHVFIDEYQDTSSLQLKILLRIKAKQYYLIGDENQCIVTGSKILTADGYKNIETLKENDLVKSGNGSNRLVDKKITSTTAHNYSGTVVEITTKTGKIIKTTPKHTHFANFSYNKNKYLVYLMYKHGVGYRIGKTEIYAKKNTNNDSMRFGFKHRLNQEHADKIWILNAYDNLCDALVYEDYYSLTYGLPKSVFLAKKTQNQTQIDKLFSIIDTNSKGIKLLNDLNFSVNQPTFVPYSKKNNITNVIIDLCVDGRSDKSIHALQINGVDKDIKKYFEDNGYITTNNGKNTGWRIRKQTNDFNKLISVISLKSDLINIILRTKLSNKSYQQLPASQIIPGMNMMICENGEIIDDEVISVKQYNEDTVVYDINVENTHNLIVNGIFTHNSIYSFSGANCELIEGLLTKERKTLRLTLSKNFRSDKNIVEHANKFSKIKAIPHSENDGSVHHKLISTVDFLLMVNDDKPLTVLARSNKTIKELEKFCLMKKLPIRYFNFITPTDIEHIKNNEINGSIKMRLDKVRSYFGSNEKLIEFIESNENSNKVITSIHKSKGREFPRVIVVNSVDPDLAEKHKIGKEHTYLTKDGDVDQEEKNIHYVAVTRPKHEIYFMVFD